MAVKNPEDVKICSRCEYFGTTHTVKSGCNSPKAPFTNYVIGTKEPEKINKNGDCQFFHKK